MKVLSTISQLLSYKETLECVLITDSREGGIFYSTDKVLVNDGGIILPKSNGGHWVRVNDEAKPVNPCWWGAKGDGATDDLTALNNAGKYCITNKRNINLPSGIFRVTDTWVIGYKFLGEQDMFNRNFTQAPSYNSEAYINARFAQPISITGENNTVIWGDFKTTELKSVVYYGLIGGGNSRNRRLQPARHGLNYITIVSQENFKDGNYTNNDDYAGSNQLGLCVPRTPSFISNGMVFYGMKVGLFGQDLYASNITNIRYKSCAHGAILLGHNASAMTNISFDRCNIGMYFSGAASTINNIWGNSCPVGLQIGGKSSTGEDYGSGNLVINGAYFENDIIDRTNVAQIIVGDDEDSSDSEIRGLTIKGMSGTAGGRTFMILKNVREVTMEGCMVYDAIITTKFEKTKINELNLTYPLNIKPLYKIQEL